MQVNVKYTSAYTKLRKAYILCTYGQLKPCRYGFKGFYDRTHKPVVLTSRSVEGIQLQVGMAGSSVPLMLRVQSRHSLTLSFPSLDVPSCLSVFYIYFNIYFSPHEFGA